MLGGGRPRNNRLYDCTVRGDREGRHVHVGSDDLLGERETPFAVWGFCDGDVTHVCPALAVKPLKLGVDGRPLCYTAAAAAAATAASHGRRCSSSHSKQVDRGRRIRLDDLQ